jgi:hypothetical protein
MRGLIQTIWRSLSSHLDLLSITKHMVQIETTCSHNSLLINQCQLDVDSTSIPYTMDR